MSGDKNSVANLLTTLTPERANQLDREGYRAGQNGKQAHDCPYGAGTAEALAWLAGWVKA